MEHNPFSAPTSDLDGAVVLDNEYQVDQSFLIVGRSAQLPSRCIVTNEPINDSMMKEQKLYWYPGWIAILFVIGGPLVMLIALLLTRKRCSIKFGVSQPIRLKSQQRFRKKGAIAAAMFVAMMICFFMDWAPIVQIFSVILLIAAIIYWMINNSQLSVAKYRKGQFWIRGCGQEFLSSLETSVPIADKP